MTRRRCKLCKREYDLRSRYFYRTHDTRFSKPKWRWSTECRRCVRARRNRQYRHLMADPYTATLERQRQRRKMRERLARDPEAREVNARRCREYRERLKVERPDDYHRILEDARIRAKLRKELAGGTLKPAKNWQCEDVYLDPAPVIALAAKLKLRERDEDATLTRALRRLKSGESKRIELHLADALAIRAGVMVSDLYPELAA